MKEECVGVLKEKTELLQKISQMTTQLASPAREDIEQSTPYKSLLLQIEHLQSEVARLESSSEKLREENTNLAAERTKFKEDLIAEHKRSLDEANDQIQRIEKDLTRVRGVRDELHHELQTRKAREDEAIQSAREISEIADTREVLSGVFNGLFRCVLLRWKRRLPDTKPRLKQNLRKRPVTATQRNLFRGSKYWRKYITFI